MIRSGRFLFALTAAGLLATLSACGTQTTAAPEALATVNDQAVTAADVANFVNGTEFLQGETFATSSKEKALELKAVVAQTAVNQWALKKHLTTMAKAKSQVNNIITKVLEPEVGGASTLKSLLSSHHLTLSSLKSYLTQEVISDSAYTEVTKHVKGPTVAQEKAYYKSNRDLFATPPEDEISDILVKTSSLAQSILKKAESGVPFATLAKEYSIASNAKTGGSMGYQAVSGSSMSQGMYDTVTKMKVGQFATYHGSQGYHVVWLQATKPAGYEPFSSSTVRKEIKATLLQNLDDKAYQAFVNKLEAHDKIVYHKKS
ncbi:MAG: peptidyl-prolyl cis-trans isomerase [Firmicutes bacterium]|nr:peptidyl-prolyl cis-trans isomerase [Bacillota bacterium]